MWDTAPVVITVLVFYNDPVDDTDLLVSIARGTVDFDITLYSNQVGDSYPAEVVGSSRVGSD